MICHKKILHLKLMHNEKMIKILIDNAEDLDIVMLMYNLLEYSDNYSMTSENLWNYYRYEVDYDDDASEGK